MKLKALASTAIVCLGQILYKNGTLPGPLIGRVEQSIDLMRELMENTTNTTDVVHMIYTGGRSESKSMLDLFNSRIRMIRPENKIFETKRVFTIHLEEQSANTVDNARYCKEIIDCIGCQSIWLVTNEFHMPRAKIIFECIYNNTGIDLLCCSADSKLSRSCEYRNLCNRPEDANQWSLNERCDWEVNALNTLNDYLSKYDIGPVSTCRVDSALKEIKTLRNFDSSIMSESDTTSLDP
jgi:hypothetical protein